MKYHVPVLLNESVEGLNIHPKGIYVDATFGGGGHSAAILSKLNGGHLFSFDQDSDAKQNALESEWFTFVHHNFAYVKNFMQYFEVEAVFRRIISTMRSAAFRSVSMLRSICVWIVR